MRSAVSEGDNVVGYEFELVRDGSSDDVCDAVVSCEKVNESVLSPGVNE